MCGAPWRKITLEKEWNYLCDAAGTLSKANQRLEHFPEKPRGMDEEAYKRGYEGTSQSNLCATGLTGSVDAYMDDSHTSKIDRVGHRRWCLNPTMLQTGFGGDGNWCAMWAIDSSGPGAKGLKAVLYPPAGYVPVDMFESKSPFSIQLYAGKAPSTKADFEVSISAVDDYFQNSGDPLELNWKDVAGGEFGNGPAIVFRPNKVLVKPGLRYRVQVTWAGDEDPAFDYLIEFCASSKELVQTLASEAPK